MLLSDSNFELKVDNHNLNCNFRFLRNLYNYIQKDPIQFLFDWINNIDKDDDSANIIMQCMSSELIDFSDLFQDEETKASIFVGISQLISACFTIKEDNKKEKNSPKTTKKSKADDIDDKFDFEDWFNKWYYFATVVLNKTEDEFLDTNITTLSALEKAHMDYQKSILISSYVDIENAKAKAVEKQSDKDNDNKQNMITINKDSNIRIRDIWK